MWARAEVCWQDETGSRCTAEATIEDTSASGACLRMKRPVTVGSRVDVKWHRGEFTAVARNCRRDGRDFLLGVRREKFAQESAQPKPEVRQVSALPLATPVPLTSTVPVTALTARLEQNGNRLSASSSVARIPSSAAANSAPGQAVAHSTRLASKISSDQERQSMESKSMFPKFWRHEPNPVAADKSPATEGPTSKANPCPPEAARAKGDWLSYEDIYRAAGILRPRSAYDINKIVEMLHSERIGAMPEEMRRASVLMAIEASGASTDDLLRDAKERQQALDTYESAQRKQLEQFEARKALENAQLEAEMARVAAHYAERIKANLDQIASEKEGLRSWEMAKQHESQRITEVIDLCTKPAEAQAAMASSGGGRNSSATRNGSGPSLVPGVVSGRPN